jgi:peptidyl-dipeptidase Dcp
MRNHLCIFACAIIGATQITAMFAAESDNPLINESVLPYHYPDFDKLKDENFVPAIEAGMREQLNEIDPIANSSEKPTFENTIVAMERTGRLLDRAADVFESERVRYEPDAAEDREGNSSKTFRASRCDFSESKIVRARAGAV